MNWAYTKITPKVSRAHPGTRLLTEMTTGPSRDDAAHRLEQMVSVPILRELMIRAKSNAVNLGKIPCHLNSTINGYSVF